VGTLWDPTVHCLRSGQQIPKCILVKSLVDMYNSKHPCTWDESLPYVQHSYNRALHSSIGHNPFQVGLGFQPLCPIDVAIPFAVTQADSLMSSLKLTRLTTSLSTFNTSTSRSMTYWTKPMLSTSSGMINIGCHTSSRWATKFGYICRRSTLLGPHRKLHPLFDMGHTPSPRLWETIPLSSTFHHSLVCTQCSM
jgi:hypothetical protein